jgi:hypothetical protein
MAIGDDDGGAADSDYALPHWYMPAPTTRRLTGWRRRVALLIVVLFAALAAYGFCSTYGFLGLG